jgi:glyoxylase-like metal-dependent hydrolase (beta-lactamase superfamily II)
MALKRDATGPRKIAADVYWLPVRGCNVYLVGSPERWVLIDAGWANCADAIRGAAETLFGPAARPDAILLTHAHPDHFGSAAELTRVWQAPIYAHRDDLPYLEGGVLPDSLLDPVGRVFKVIERVLPAHTVERIRSSPLKGMVHVLPVADAPIPGMPGWECIHTPGHSPGHVVFFRRQDRVLVAGDAVLTAPLWGAVPAVQRLSRPPWFVSWDWGLAQAAAATLAQCEPRVLATGHGVPMSGDQVARELADFAAHRRPRAAF